MSGIKIIECPRDAMQGLNHLIPLDVKVNYIKKLLSVGFDTIDVGSFVSPKAIPQMADTSEVLNQIGKNQMHSQLLVIVANKRGIDEAVLQKGVHYLGFPFSVSETFQQRNTNAGIEAAFDTVKYLTNVCRINNKKPVVYLSMAFGNPYGDPWNAEIVMKWADKLIECGVDIISLADTIGVAQPKTIEYLFSHLVPGFSHVEFGAHLHTQPNNWHEKLEAAFSNGCRRFDGAIMGFGGCPMAKDELVGNMATENLLHFFDEKGINLGLNMQAFGEALTAAPLVFNH